MKSASLSCVLPLFQSEVKSKTCDMKISLSLQVNENSFSNQRFRTEPRFETEANDPLLSTATVVQGLSQPTKNILYALSFVTHLLRPVSIKFDFSTTSETRSCHCGVARQVYCAIRQWHDLVSNVVRLPLQMCRTRFM